MSNDQSFHEYVIKEVLEDISGITSRAMFGGWGIYKNGIIFAIIAEGELYFKVDEKIKANFKKEGSRPFVYQGKHKPMEMSYWLVPDNIIENKKLISEWVDHSVQAAIRSKTKK